MYVIMRDGKYWGGLIWIKTSFFAKHYEDYDEANEKAKELDGTVVYA